MAFAILRTAKLTKIGNISGSAMHNFRERTTPNADAALTFRNNTAGAKNTEEVIAKVIERLQTVPTVRKNAVLAVEYFIGASPEFFKENNTQTREAYFDAAQHWLYHRHGEKNVISVTRQYDEITPHICAFVVPIDPNGKLNCSHFLDGRVKLSEMQTDFANQCGLSFGLQRGIEGSSAKHQTVKEYYAKIQEPTPELKTQVPPEPEPPTMKQKLASSAGFRTEYDRAREEYDQARQKRQEEELALRKAEQAKAKQYELERAANKARETRLAQLRESSTQVRDLPLVAILERLGAVPDPSDKNNWKTPTGRVSVDGAKFYNHDLGQGGGGAIDLVIAQSETDYRGAVNWLSREFGTGAVLAETAARFKLGIEAIASENPSLDPLKAHQPTASNWEHVRGYLVDTRQLGGALIDSLHEQGQIYADKFNNAVFVLGAGKGLALRGTGENPFHGVRGEKVPFVLAASEQGSKQVAFVESPIDALSLRELGFKGGIVATMGNASEVVKQLAHDYRKKGLEPLGAFDNDSAGRAMTRNLGDCEVLKPKGKDWNDDLRARRLAPGQQQAWRKSASRDRDSSFEL